MAPSSKAKTHVLKNLDLPSILEPAETPSHIAGTKVIATLGPACRDVDTLVDLLESGLAAARIDLTWGSLEYHKQSLRNLQLASQKTKLLCAVILDTVGRELMIRRDYELDSEGWPTHKEVLEIKKGQELVVTTDETAVASSTKLPISYPHFAHMCQPGDSLFVGRYLVNGADQSSLYLEVKEVEGQNVVCTAVNDAVLDGLLTTDLPLLTQLDEEAIKMYTKEFEIDYINLTYTCSGLDVHEMREFLDEIGSTQVKIIAKVENLQALQNFDSIVAAADAVVLSRGNLGLDVAPEKTAVVQKAAINRCNLQGKPVIITRLVDTMVEAPRCTRAEATDVANAVLDGVDGMLLGAETLRGRYAVETVRTVLSICRQAELAFDYEEHFEHMITSAMDVRHHPHRFAAGLIICYAGTGRTASLIAKYRPTVPILALVVPNLKSKGLSWELEGRFLARQFQVMRGLIPLLGAPMGGANSEQMLAEAVSVALKRGLVRAKQHVVCVLSVRGDFMLKVVSVDDRQGVPADQRQVKAATDPFA
ncbi:Phosphoenolpyruvate/pyruvate domain-containing protein [Coccomyxa subellipsoidea C-169]|uniref:Pyruvate kinase n=1 Tax=Coccomyxa subellipsoidea (strain C-169) TaxID=574566 RepID=I0YT17_COCSC|nr:Phosphoenolpyruvate/pyruvate domain-containing protein [Coccomyxa subellipsoidea C-169]EIE21536.1 Phosphoenolpyruvate/pyruvate domain-containing protein [Coccomyxa subellipsoidea C-169]|eukprot:XP_005646080.1 Phosphoenolpyruvate/pyruvate domain-containing protein [Coccomyxa subellipsoidea C-169]